MTRKIHLFQITLPGRFRPIRRTIVVTNKAISSLKLCVNSRSNIFTVLFHRISSLLQVSVFPGRYFTVHGLCQLEPYNTPPEQTYPSQLAPSTSLILPTDLALLSEFRQSTSITGRCGILGKQLVKSLSHFVVDAFLCSPDSYSFSTAS